MLPPGVDRWPDDVSHIRPEIQVLQGLQTQFNVLETEAAEVAAGAGQDCSSEASVLSEGACAADLFESGLALSESGSD